MKKIFVPSVAAVLLAGCSFMPDFARPAVDAPAQFSRGADTAPDVIARDWWRNFGSAELNDLMGRALANNLDLRAAVQRVEQARASARIAGAALLPSANASGGISRDRVNPVTGATSTDTRINAGAGVAYEIDLFGRNRAAVQGAQANLTGSEFDREALNLVVMGDVARTYFDLLNARERLKIADDNLKNARDLMRIVEARLEAGAASRLEVAQQRSALSSTEATRASVEQSIKIAENALAVLLGAAPQTLSVSGQTLAGLDVPAIAPGQPSTLLDRRPDIRAAEQNLVAADADIAVARAAFFPTVTLGLDASIATAGFGDPASTAVGILASLATPLFSGGRLEGGVQLATARQAELAENYRQAVLVSFREVEDALAAVKAAEERERALAVSAREAQSAYQLSRELYDAGAVDFQTLLDSQRVELSAKDAYSQSRNERLAAAVDLYLALGGGWQENMAADSAPARQKGEAVPPATPAPATPAATAPVAPAPDLSAPPR